MSTAGHSSEAAVEIAICEAWHAIAYSCWHEWFKGGSSGIGQPLMIICASSFMCFSHALARGGCQHTRNDLVYCVIIMVVVADQL